MTNRKRKSLESTAHHEAGHAVMAHLLHWRIKSVTVIPDKDALGRVVPTPLRNFNPETDGRSPDVSRTECLAIRSIMFSLAGPVAEGFYLGRGWNQRGACSDSEHAADMADYVCGADTKESNALLKWLIVRVQNILAPTHVRAAIHALAAELVKHRHLSGPRAREIIVNAILG